jgi:hypothetical protein
MRAVWQIAEPPSTRRWSVVPPRRCPRRTQIVPTGCSRLNATEAGTFDRSTEPADRQLGEQPLSGQVMTQRDNWGWQARIGMFIVGGDARNDRVVTPIT